jgi:hypothetical protein
MLENELIYKYNENKLLEEIKDYIDSSYTSHYVGKDNTQALDLIFASGHGEGFCIGDILKYGSRYGKKAGKNRKDLVKIVHYALLMLYVHDCEVAEQETTAEPRVFRPTTPGIFGAYNPPTVGLQIDPITGDLS